MFSKSKLSSMDLPLCVRTLLLCGPPSGMSRTVLCLVRNGSISSHEAWLSRQDLAETTFKSDGRALVRVSKEKKKQKNPFWFGEHIPSGGFPTP